MRIDFVIVLLTVDVFVTHAQGYSCNNTCIHAGDGSCDDGGFRSDADICSCGTDCDDCGSRYLCYYDTGGYSVRGTNAVGMAFFLIVAAFYVVIHLICFLSPCLQNSCLGWTTSREGGSLGAQNSCATGPGVEECDYPPNTEISDCCDRSPNETTREARISRGYAALIFFGLFLRWMPTGEAPSGILGSALSWLAGVLLWPSVWVAWTGIEPRLPDVPRPSASRRFIGHTRRAFSKSIISGCYAMQTYISFNIILIEAYVLMGRAGIFEEKVILEEYYWYWTKVVFYTLHYSLETAFVLIALGAYHETRRFYGCLVLVTDIILAVEISSILLDSPKQHMKDAGALHSIVAYIAFQIGQGNACWAAMTIIGASTPLKTTEGQDIEAQSTLSIMKRTCGSLLDFFFEKAVTSNARIVAAKEQPGASGNGSDRIDHRIGALFRKLSLDVFSLLSVVLSIVLLILERGLTERLTMFFAIFFHLMLSAYLFRFGENSKEPTKGI
eukprot:CAMPEP_0197430856 /NCGR_PEP_ID=MMETSP1170-20131217/52858_1 /TAXON_ID=54406 /ORGANISM="Sarcinochrysis sp, Strain CCMP770" /LENGTH=498 /DNA_ID=CAMNT_0042958787 /DNA_START=109 /DNA_END=1606 /DNA_ORIENTATION=+